MPYIEQKVRDDLNLGNRLPETPGELNYAITMICLEHIERKGISYTNINEVIGALECAKLELYRRIAAPYEDAKITQNGDVY